MSKSFNVKVTTQEQRDQLIKQLQEISFNKEAESWEDYLNTIDSDFVVGIIRDNLDRMKWVGKQYKALYKLEQLKDYYNDGWKPDWTDDSCKHIISFMDGSITPKPSYCRSFFLAFKTKNIRDKFLENHRDLIEQAKPLL